jgi:hypothetical protein
MTTIPMPAPGSVFRRFLPLLILLVLFLAIEFLCPRFPDNDEVISKAAGRNLGAGGSFSAPELEGFLQLNPPAERVFFAHPPVYSWLFGQASKCLGFGWKVCVGYDGFISAALAICVFGLARRMRHLPEAERASHAFLSLVPALLTLLLRQPGRPDELAMVFSYAALWSLSAGPIGIATALLSGFLTGLTLCTSTGVVLGLLPLIAGFWLLHVDRSRWPLLLALSAAGAVAATALCLVPLYLIEPTFYRQFFQHASAVVTSPWDRIRGEMGLIVQVAPGRIFIMLATLPLLFLGLSRSWNARPRLETLTIYIAPMAGFLLLFCLRSAHTYWWFLQPWFLIVALLVATQGWQRKKVSSLLSTAWLTLWVSAALIWPAKGYVARMTLPPEQRISYCEERLRQIIPPGSTVLTTKGWWALAGDHTVIDPTFSEIDLNRIDFFVGDGNGTGEPGKWGEPENPRYADLLRTELEIIRDDLPRERAHLFGQTVSRSAYGFGPIVLQRTSKPAITSKPGN